MIFYECNIASHVLMWYWYSFLLIHTWNYKFSVYVCIPREVIVSGGYHSRESLSFVYQITKVFDSNFLDGDWHAWLEFLFFLIKLWTFSQLSSKSWRKLNSKNMINRFTWENNWYTFLKQYVEKFQVGKKLSCLIHKSFALITTLDIRHWNFLCN